MKLAASSYDYKPIADQPELLCSDALLHDRIERIQGEFAGYGYRRLGKQLRREGICVICVNDKRIRRVQRQYQLFPIGWQSFKIATTDSNHGHAVYPNLLAELTVTRIHQAWVADTSRYVMADRRLSRRTGSWTWNAIFDKAYAEGDRASYWAY